MALLAARVFFGSVLLDSAAGFRRSSQGSGSLVTNDFSLNASDRAVHDATANGSDHALEEHGSTAKASDHALVEHGSAAKAALNGYERMVHNVEASGAGHALEEHGSTAKAALNGSERIVHSAAANVSVHVLEEHGSTAKATVSASGVPAPEMTQDRIMHDLGVAADSKCSAGAAPGNLGCSLGCTCEWHQQCYPKYIYINDGAHLGAEWAAKRFDVGACEPGMPILIVSSVGLFVGALLVVVTGRMLLLGQFAARDAVDAAALHLPPAPYAKPPMVVVPAAGISSQAQSIVTADAPRQHKPKKAPSDFSSPPPLGPDGPSPPPSGGKPLVSSQASSSSRGGAAAASSS